VIKIAIIGYGKQGLSAYNYWQLPGAEITICDRMSDIQLPPNTQSQLGVNYLANLDRFDLIIRSPSIHPRDIVAGNSQMTLKKITTVTDEFLRVCPSRKIIGITGTKGKGTTSTLITKMLEANGKRVHLGGNIGTPPLDMLSQGIQIDDWVVLELANFQLIDLKKSPHIAVCLMVVPEHLDWHTDVNEYYEAKAQLFTNQKPEDIAVYYNDNETSKKIAGAGSGQKIPYMAQPGAYVENNEIRIDKQTICKTSELKLRGKHNWQNACAATTVVWQITKDVDTIRNVLTSFSGLEHRLELVRSLDQVVYYDDSFGTTPETSIVAIQAFQAPKVLILGGSDKGASYDELASIVATNNVRSVILIGQQGDHIKAALTRAGFEKTVEGGETMLEIVHAARTEAEPGDIVLLSTACASFDMFKNYIDRGDQFKTAVQALV
jgi:UDP-N-acetylmuramoylalanine--D-glutamate ligase